MPNKCLKCDTDNPSDSKFCKECATPLPSSKEIPVTETIETSKEELTRGTTFAGRYEIIEELGKGGMGKVYRVEDKKIREEVALKLIRPEIASDKKTIERFKSELKIARKIRHKNVCGTYDLDEKSGTYYFTMEYIPGEDLKSFIRRSGQLAIGTTIKMAKQVSEGLAEAHGLGVIHRDLKPSNIMIDRDGNVRIMDFGIARLLTSDSMTQSGMMIGTPHYMSPEQVASEKVDLRSDIYSLGVVLYEMATGRLPFKGDSAISVALKHKTDLPKDPRELDDKIPKELSVLILKCLKKNKEKRFQSAKDLLLELKTIEKRIPVTDKTLLKRKTLQKRRIRAFTILGIFLSVALITVGGYFLYERFLKGKIGEKEEKIPVVLGVTTLEKKELIPQYGIVEINSFPGRAEVYLDNKREGVTPFKRELKPGDYQIQIKKEPGYKEISEVLNIKAAETFSKSYTLNPIYILNINTIPEGAGIKIDGNYKGKSPVQIEIPRNKCQITIEKGIQWTKIDEQLTLNPGKNLIQRSLEKIKYSLFIKTNPPGARVFIEDKLMGISPLRKLDLFGECDIKIEKDGYTTVLDSIAVHSDSEKTFDLIKLETRTDENKLKKSETKSNSVAKKLPEKILTITSPRFGPINTVLEPFEIWSQFGLEPEEASYPVGIAVESSGNIYVSDKKNKLIYKFDSSGKFIKKWSPKITADKKTIVPHGIAVDNIGNIYVCDTDNHRIVKFASEGEFKGELGTSRKPQEQLNTPHGIALDNSGYIYVCDTYNHRIVKYSPEGKIVTNWGARGKSQKQFILPTGIAIDNTGNIFIADRGNHRIQIFSDDGTFIGDFSAAYAPSGVALDNFGYIYITDIIMNKIYKYTIAGAFVAERGSKGENVDQFSMPWGIVIDNSGYALIADTKNNRMKRYKIR